MHQLLLLRHAKSSWGDAALPDRERPLNKRGHRGVAAIRDAMREMGLAPDLVLVSPARRTQETLAALEPWDDTPLVDPVETLYLASATQLLAILRGISETVRSVLVIGHNPGLHELAILLAARHGPATPDQATGRLLQGFPTAALAEFVTAVPWREIGPGNAQLVHFLTPRDLREDGTPETAP
jgi:phosphohistidine phosphatase